MNGFLPDVGLTSSLPRSLVVGEIERNGSTDVEINYSSLKVRCQFRESRERDGAERDGAGESGGDRDGSAVGTTLRSS